MSSSFADRFKEIWEIPEARWIIWITLLAAVVLIGVYVAVYFRNLAFGKSDSGSDDLSQFRRLKEEGKLGDKEFAQLKSTLKDQRNLIPDKKPPDKPNNL